MFLVLKILQNSQENTWARVYFFNKVAGAAYKFAKKETLAQVFSCELCKIFKNNIFTEHLWMTASGCAIKHLAVVFVWSFLTLIVLRNNHFMVIPTFSRWQSKISIFSFLQDYKQKEAGGNDRETEVRLWMICTHQNKFS